MTLNAKVLEDLDARRVHEALSILRKEVLVPFFDYSQSLRNAPQPLSVEEIVECMAQRMQLGLDPTESRKTSLEEACEGDSAT